MIVGVPKEIKTEEYRAGMVPGGVKKLIERGHKVLVEKGAGIGSGLPDAKYKAVGATIVDDADSIWSDADLIVKVKEPIEVEYDRIRENQIIYTYLQVRPDYNFLSWLCQGKYLSPLIHHLIHCGMIAIQIFIDKLNLITPGNIIADLNFNQSCRICGSRFICRGQNLFHHPHQFMSSCIVRGIIAKTLFGRGAKKETDGITPVAYFL